MGASLCASVRSSCFCINLNISFIYKDIFTKFAAKVYGYENLCLKNFSLILKTKMAAIANCLMAAIFKSIIGKQNSLKGVHVRFVNYNMVKFQTGCSIHKRIIATYF